jgi:hypothetical protein
MPTFKVKQRRVIGKTTVASKVYTVVAANYPAAVAASTVTFKTDFGKAPTEASNWT